MRPVLLVLTSTYPRWRGDPEPAFVHELCRRLTSCFDVHVLCPHAPGAATQEDIDGITVYRYRYAPVSMQTLVQGGGIVSNLKHSRWKWLLVPSFIFGQIYAVARLNRKLSPACIHAHWIVPQGFALRILRGFGTTLPPILLTSHGGDLYGLRGAILSRLKKWIIQGMSAVSVVSDPMVALIENLGARKDRTYIIPMGVDLQERFSVTFPGNRDPDELLFVGRLVEKKGVRYLLEAMPIIAARFPNARLTIVGYGPAEASLRQLASTLGVVKHVRFVGAVSQHLLPDYYQRAAVCVAPSVEAADGDQEGLPVVTVEAAACGCPLVVSAIPAARDLVRYGMDPAMLVPPADSQALADRICAVLAAPEASQRQAAAFLECIRGTLDWSIIAAKYADALKAAANIRQH